MTDIPDVVERVLPARGGRPPVAYRVRGDGRPVVLVNGLGGSVEIWRHQYALLGRDHRVISWDYRGLFGSAAPSPGAVDASALGPQQLTPAQHARDLLEILARERIERALFVGWSMGVNVTFECHRLRPERVAGIVALNPPPPRAYATMVPLYGLLRDVGLLLNTFGAGLFGRGVRRAASWRGLVPTLRGLGLVDSSVDERAFVALARQFGGSTEQFEIYGHILRKLAEHDFTAHLCEVEVPTLVLAGARDRITPPAAARAVVDGLTATSARLVIIDGGTHYMLVEQAERVGHHVHEFLRQIEV